MYIQVKLLKGFKEPLLYQIYPEWVPLISCGSLVKVPLRNQKVFAYVQKIFDLKPSVDFAIKFASHVEPLPRDTHYFTFITKLAEYYQTEPHYFLKRLRLFLEQKKAFESPITLTEQSHQPAAVALTQEQAAITSFLAEKIKNPTFTPTLLHGVTGSGKTEVYKKLIEETIQAQKSVIFLLPEVTLACQFLNLLKAQLPSTIMLTSFHSAIALSEKKKLWQELLQAKPLVIIGVHLPLLLPLANLGLIIIDEEHDVGYQEKKHPKINTKEAALLRAQINKIPLLLGSGTPSITSLYNVTNKKWHFFQLKDRFKGVFPSITVIPLINHKERKNFWITTALEQALKSQLQKKEQTIIFLNRRGFSFFVQCKNCSFIFYCSSCSVSLTLHEHNELMCHYCGYKVVQPPRCTKCSSQELINKGIGTQQIVQILQKLFPTARIARADHDTTMNKKKWKSIITDFYNGDLDILVGTQTITKGYHFPKVSLVGVLWADLSMHFPLYNALETTMQQLIQVAGRAGRSGLESKVIIQTMADHDIFSYLNEVDYLQFYHHELETRKAVGYPPCVRLAEIELKHHNEQLLCYEAERIASHCTTLNTAQKLSVTVLGPSKPPVSKLKNWHMRKIYLKSSNIHDLLKLFQTIDSARYQSFIAFTPNPLT